jgi:hypothetical protein
VEVRSTQNAVITRVQSIGNVTCEMSAMQDFEMAVLEALKSTFPSSKIRGCWFHFSQNLFRNAQALGLQPKYQSDRKFKNKIKLLSALAFVPVHDVQKQKIVMDSSHYKRKNPE